MKKLPWLSLALLLFAYSSFSWFLYSSLEKTWIIWSIALGFAILQAMLLTALSKSFRTFLGNWLESDVGYFSVVAMGSVSIAFILAWFHLFEYVLMLVGAEFLARLDLQNAGFNQWQALGVLTLVSVMGLVVGWIAYRELLVA